MVVTLIAARDDEVQRTVLRESGAPGEGLVAGDAVILLRPAFTVVGGLVNTESKGARIQRAAAHGAGGIEQNVGDGLRRHAGNTRLPVQAPIGGDGHSAHIVLRANVIPIPNLGPGQIVLAAECAPDQPALRGETHIGVIHKDVFGIEGVELDAVVGGYIQAAGDPTAILELP